MDLDRANTSQWNILSFRAHCLYLSNFRVDLTRYGEERRARWFCCIALSSVCTHTNNFVGATWKRHVCPSCHFNERIAMCSLHHPTTSTTSDERIARVLRNLESSRVEASPLRQSWLQERLEWSHIPFHLIDYVSYYFEMETLLMLSSELFLNGWVTDAHSS